jgi:ribosomal protein L22
MSKKIEILPVTADEAICLLGSLKIEEAEKLLEDIKTLREQKIFNKIPILEHTTQKTEIAIK